MSHKGLKCELCKRIFETNKGFHRHIKTSHNLTQKDYYTKYFPKKSWLYNKPIIFKNKKDYFFKNFNSPSELRKWCKTAEKQKVKEEILRLLKSRVKEADLEFAPSHNELLVKGLPGVDTYIEAFGSYSKVCEILGVKPLFGSRAKPEVFTNSVAEQTKEMLILVDPREQKALKFKNQRILKLDFGDYTAAGKDYKRTFIERKSENDFKSTLSQANLERFRNELQRAKDFNSYLYILVESSIENIIKYNNCSFGGAKEAPHKFNLPFLWHNMRIFQHDFKDCCQFIFSGNRTNSTKLIPVLLMYGKALWDVDLQYYIDKYGIDC